MLRFSGAGVSDVGLVREHNEDSAFVAPYVALVADGVGGAAAGEVASATAAYVVSALALSRFGDDPGAVIRDAVAAARINLRHGVRDDPSRDGMATTLTVVVGDGERVLLGHVGDSRAYHYRDGRLEQISRDHTYVQTLVDSGLVSREEMAFHPWRNVVLRSLQASPEDELTDVDVLEVDTRPGDRLLLCSDGLTDMVPDDRIAEVLRLNDPHSAAAVLTHAALAAGGRDNITAVVLDVVEGPQVVGDGRLLGAVFNFENIVDPAYVRRS
jgi:serine/threonine protein phosphatase PrpC